jgi:hypothetical protein
MVKERYTPGARRKLFFSSYSRTAAWYRIGNAGLGELWNIFVPERFQATSRAGEGILKEIG